MTRETTLLRAAIEDNIAWCGAVCASHHSVERHSENAWVNLAPSPPFYPNIITRRPHSQADIVRLVEDIRQHGVTGAWGIKDSFHDLDLVGQGFDAAIEGEWFGGEPPAQREGPVHDWEIVRTSEELSLWQDAWNGDTGHPIFKDALLKDERIRFWMLRSDGDVIAGCISFASDRVTGLSNWFSVIDESVFDLGMMHLLAEARPGRPVVFWASGDDSASRASGFRRLGKLRVWIAKRCLGSNSAVYASWQTACFSR